MKLIPPTITDLASSKKAVTFWVILGLWLPASREFTNLTDAQLIWVSIAYMGYALGQGLSDFGKGAAEAAAAKGKKK